MLFVETVDLWGVLMIADELERLAKEATPGRWQNGIEDLEGVVAPDNPGLGNVICLPPTNRMYSSLDFWPANAALIVALRNALPEIVSALRREEWQGIETAPRPDEFEPEPVMLVQGGRRFLAQWDASAGHFQAFYAFDGVERDSYFQEFPGRLHSPSLWAALPPPPKGTDR